MFLFCFASEHILKKYRAQKLPVNMNILSYSLLAVLLSLCILEMDGKGGSKKGSKGGKSGVYCFDDPNECTDRMTSAKGSNPAMAFQIWCKKDSKEKCIAGKPHSHSIAFYTEGRCDTCSFVPFFSTFLSNVRYPKRVCLASPGWGALHTAPKKEYSIVFVSSYPLELFTPL